MIKPPQRTHAHQIDSDACTIVESKFSDCWENRELSGRDFGIDRIVERFQDGYATSEILLLQIKGTEIEIDTDNPRFSLQTKTLLYAEMFTVPFLLVYCQVNNPKQCYYIWLQEYINVRLNYDNPDWRNQQTNTLYFPKENILGSEKSKEHLKYIAGFPKFKASWLQYYLCLDELNNLPRSYNYDDMDKQAIDYIIKPALDKLEEGKKTVKNIPKRFIPDCYEKAIQIGNDILNYTEKPDYMKFFSFISMCQDIHASIGMIALTFDASHMRIFYESENGSRY